MFDREGVQPVAGPPPRAGGGAHVHRAEADELHKAPIPVVVTMASMVAVAKRVMRNRGRYMPAPHSLSPPTRRDDQASPEIF